MVKMYNKAYSYMHALGLPKWIEAEEQNVTRITSIILTVSFGVIFLQASEW